MIIDTLTAVSINGFIAEKGKSSLCLLNRFSSINEILDFQYQVRRRYDAIMVGTNTVIIDDPKLTSHKEKSSKPFCRISLDCNGRIPREHNFFDGSEKTYIGLTSNTPKEYVEFLESKNIQYCLAGENQFDFKRFFKFLENRGINKILVEGGGELITSLLRIGVVNKMILIQMPLILKSDSTRFISGDFVLKNLKLAGLKKIGGFSVVSYELLA